MSYDQELGKVWEKIFAPLGSLRRMRATCFYGGYIASIMWSFKWRGLKEMLCGRNLVHVTRNRSLPSLLPPLGPRATYFYSSEKGPTNLGICFVSCEILKVRRYLLAREPNISLTATPQSGYVLLFRRPTFRSSPHLLLNWSLIVLFFRKAQALEITSPLKSGAQPLIFNISWATSYPQYILALPLAFVPSHESVEI
jgi:hypothetical protein